MKSWQDEQLQLLHSEHGERGRYRVAAAIARDLGFDFCAYGLRIPLPVSAPRVVLHNNYPLAWQHHYRDNDYLACDPSVRHALTSLAPLQWNDDLFADARELWEEARAHGLKVGWAQSCRDGSGAIGMLTLARTDEPLSAGELVEKQFRMGWFAQIVHIAISELVTPRLLPEGSCALSERERAVLRWTAEGKTSAEVASILRISVHTVNFHVNSSMRKLNACNKTAAAVKAATLGLIY